MDTPVGSLSERTAETPIASTVHHPFGSPAGPGLFHHKGLQLPAYIQNVAHAFTRKGLSESEAIARAVGVVKDWAAGRAPNGGKVHPDVQAAAAKAVAEWEAAKAGVQRFNPFHAPPGPGGGEFTSGGGGGGGGKAASSKPASQAGKKAAAQSASKTRLLQRAAAYRKQADEMEKELHTLEAELKQHQKTAKAQKQQQAKNAKQAQHQKAAAHKASHITSKHHKHATHHKSATHHHSAKHLLSLRQRIASLKVKIAGLRQRARQLEHQAHSMRSYEDGCWG